MNIINVILEIIKNIGPYMAALNAVIVALIALFVLIPGKQPEEFLQKVVDFIAKISRK